MPHEHFDLATVLNAFDNAQADVRAAIDACLGKTETAKAMEKRSTELVGRAGLQFIVECRNGGYDHQEVAEVIGGMLANIATMAIENWPCRCTRGRIMESFSLNLGAMVARDPRTSAGPLIEIQPMQGGRA